jgi:hypothetical protein
MMTKKTMASTMTAWGGKPQWAQLRTSKTWSQSRNALNVGRNDTGLHNVPRRKKGQSEKASAAADASVKETKSMCSHCGKPGHKEEDCWKKHPHKAPARSSTEASGIFLDKELLVCNIA